jgi:hypothetical protein
MTPAHLSMSAFFMAAVRSRNKKAPLAQGF